MIMKHKVKSLLTIVIFLGLLTGCQTVYMKETVQSTENTVPDPRDKESCENQSAEMTKEKMIENQIEEFLQDKSYKLIWAISEIPEANQLFSYKIYPLDVRELWKDIQNTVFPDSRTLLTQKDEEYEQIDIAYENEKYEIRIHDNSLSIPKGTDLTGIQKILDILRQQTGMDWFAKKFEGTQGYACKLGDAYIYEDGKSEGEKHYPGSHVALGWDRISIENPVRLEGNGENLAGEHFISEEEIRFLCEAQWEAYAFQGVGVLDQVTVTYLPYEEGTKLMPAWLLSGVYYESCDGTAQRKANLSILIEPLTGKVLGFHRE